MSRLKKNLKISKIRIQLPDCFEIKDFINIEKLEQNGNQVDVFDIGRSSLSKYDYFGLTIATREPFDELAVQSKITITLFESDNTTSKLKRLLESLDLH